MSKRELVRKLRSRNVMIRLRPVKTRSRRSWKRWERFTVAKTKNFKSSRSGSTFQAVLRRTKKPSSRTCSRRNRSTIKTLRSEVSLTTRLLRSAARRLKSRCRIRCSLR